MVSKEVFFYKIILVCVLTVTARQRGDAVFSFLATLPGFIHERQAKMITLMVDTAFDLPAGHLTVVYEKQRGSFITWLCMTLQFFGIKTSLYKLERNMESLAYLEKLEKDVKDRSSAYLDGNYLFMVPVETSEDVISMIHQEKLGRRNIIYLFLWPEKEISQLFCSNVDEVVRVGVITNPRRNTYHVYYNQAEPDGSSELKMINWWTWPKGYFQNPLLPPSSRVYKDLKGRVFIVPVLHKPPWHFVEFNNNSLQVEGGRDDKLLSILSQQLNFKYEYFDPPDRSEGSALVNGTMQGVLGLLWQGEVEVFIGDLTVTFERSLVVEFSFFTLSDSEVFLTHAPGKLNEALALIRPFRWEVWPAVVFTVGLSGPLLFLLKKSHSGWKSMSLRELCDCIWISATIFLRQSLVTKIHGDLSRIAVIILYLVATYVIGDMYSANLTSLLTRPAREKPVSTLEQLNYAMEERNFKLLVERHSASHGVFENGSGLYESVHYFHLSEKLYTSYSAIALQIGCPFVDQFNKLIIIMFESGILSKITEDEYLKLRENQVPSSGKTSKRKSEATEEVGEGEAPSEDDKTLKPMSMKTLQGAFYVLIVGCSVASFVILMEILVNKYT
ncbi:hypothetical protein GE061_001281 [Apolygus lucorum]|uniref:Ionotropic glutamate receptor C-terminal domain-containing protein n=1 Tax=Apolygus lucorum TaxID=248454 RepID=A0A8S9Y6M6_APOLU|nr:hypothetical protein GE061_001281 [Apolygus lucorum]